MKFLAVVTFAAALGVAVAAPTYDLHDDLQEFVELIPIEKMREVARKYIATDVEVQRALAYLKGEEWSKLVHVVRDHPTWKELKAYMLEAGIDVDVFISAIHNIITGAGNSANKQVPGTYSMRTFMDEIRGLVPIQALLELLNKKLANSADFQAFWVKISSDNAHNMVQEIRALPEVQRVAQVLRDMSLDVDLALDFIYALLGWSK